jgi:hypothetical protein
MQRDFAMVRLVLGLFLALMVNDSTGSVEGNIEVFNFKVLLDDREVGRHTFVVEDRGNQVAVTSEASMDFTVLLVKKVEYRHQASEIWQNGCLLEFKSSTQRNNKSVHMSGKMVDDTFVINHEQGETSLGTCIKSFPYWRPKWLEGEFLLNVETGKYAPVSLQSKTDSLTQSTYKTISLPKTEIRLEYDKAGDWQQLESDLKIVGTLRYQRIPDTFEEQL